MADPIRNAIVSIIRKGAEAFAAANGVTGADYDPFVHALTSAVLTQMFGENIARYLGEYWEDRPGNDVRDRNMDLWNDWVGREIGKTSSPFELIQRVKEMLEPDAEGDTGLIKDFENDPRTDPANFPSDLLPYFDPNAPARPDDFPSLWELEGYSDFSSAQRWFQPPRRDPLTLDLDGDGIETVPTTAGVLFDHDGDGIKHGTGWVGADDGFLVLDRNGNGTIDNGSELFGDSTPLYTGGNAADGFAALAQEDTNADGTLSNLDLRWNDLRIWRDLDQDGISDEGELFTLADLGIESINVASIEHSQTLPNGNQIADVGTYTRSDGSTGAVAEVADLADVNLAVDTVHREFTDQVPFAEGVTALPDMQGSGLVRDLWEAMSQSPTLQGLVQQFAAATTKAEQMALLDSLLDAWADTSGLADSLDDRTNAYKIRYMAFGAVTRAGHVSAPEGSGTLDTDATSVELADDLDNLRLDAEYKALILQWDGKIHALEAFNGRVQTLMISYSQDQLNLLQQSYDALRGRRCAAANDATWRACA